MKKDKQILFAICLDNEGYKASLEVGKLYQIIPDNEADAHGYIRIIGDFQKGGILSILVVISGHKSVR
jgi:hypothetical protein